MKLKEIIARLEDCRDREGVGNQYVIPRKFDALLADLRRADKPVEAPVVEAPVEEPKVTETVVDAAPEAPVTE